MRRTLKPRSKNGAGPRKYNRKAALAEVRAKEASREASRWKR